MRRYVFICVYDLYTYVLPFVIFAWENFISHHSYYKQIRIYLLNYALLHGKLHVICFHPTIRAQYNRKSKLPGTCHIPTNHHNVIQV